MLLSKAIEALVTATIADGRSPRTVEMYRSYLGYLLDFLGDRPVEEITIDDLRAYAAYLRSRTERYPGHPRRVSEKGPLSPYTVAAYLRPVRRLFRWLEEERIISDNPARRLKITQPGRHEPKAISIEDFQKLLAATEGDEPHQRRNRALLLFLADTGCRVGGIERLRVEDVDLDRGLARVTEKGNKTRLVPFSEVTKDALLAWLEVRPVDKGPWLFVNLGVHGEDRLTADAIGEVLRRLKQRAGVKGPCNPHAFRHGFAREYLRAGGDLASLADILGHSSVEVTWRFYSVYRAEELKAFHDRYSPVARMQREQDDSEDQRST